MGERGSKSGGDKRSWRFWKRKTVGQSEIPEQLEARREEIERQLLEEYGKVPGSNEPFDMEDQRARILPDINSVSFWEDKGNEQALALAEELEGIRGGEKEKRRKGETPNPFTSAPVEGEKDLRAEERESTAHIGTLRKIAPESYLTKRENLGPALKGFKIGSGSKECFNEMNTSLDGLRSRLEALKDEVTSLFVESTSGAREISAGEKKALQERRAYMRRAVRIWEKEKKELEGYIDRQGHIIPKDEAGKVKETLEELKSLVVEVDSVGENLK